MLAGHWQDYKYELVHAVKTRGLAVGWAALSKKSLQPAGFNAPELLFPIMRQDANSKLVTIDHGADTLLALPLVEKRTHFKSLASPLLASGMPHISRDMTETVLLAFLNGSKKPVLFNAIPSEGAFLQMLQNQAAQFETIESWQRAALKPSGKYQDWFEATFDQKRRKEFKRLRARLAEAGTLELLTLKKGDNPKLFVKDLLALEAAGWKGKKGTAISAMPRLTNALYEAAIDLHAAGKLRFWSLKFNGQSIASLFAIVEGEQAWLGKIAYDENFAKYSPGVMVILDCTESFFAEKKIKLVDSSAIPNHPMIDRIWRDRIAMTSVIVAPSSISTNRFKFVVKMLKLRLDLRSKLRNIYHKIKGTKRS
jgi:CelD/BcsL family acetyltransferase involved in cellulose biosynthesis